MYNKSFGLKYKKYIKKNVSTLFMVKNIYRGIENIQQKFRVPFSAITYF